MKSAQYFLLVALGSFVSSTALAQHVHGLVQLGVVVEDGTVAVSLDAPMSDVAGFEHAPKDEDQATRIEEVASMLADADAMFGLPESAACEVSATSIEGPAFVTQHLAQEDAGEAGHDHDHHESDHGHDSDHDHHDHHDETHDHDEEHDHHGESDDHDHHEHHDHDEHSEINANYEWVCGDVSKLDVLELRFTQGFASVETIEIQLLTAAGAQVMKKEGRVASIPLSAQ